MCISTIYILDSTVYVYNYFACDSFEDAGYVSSNLALMSLLNCPNIFANLDRWFFANCRGKSRFDWHKSARNLAFSSALETDRPVLHVKRLFIPERPEGQ